MLHAIARAAGAAAIAVVCAGSALASSIQLRDAEGGDGYYLDGTARETHVIVDGRYDEFNTGVFDFEARLGGGDWVSLETICLEIDQKLSLDGNGSAYQVQSLDEVAGLNSSEIDLLSRVVATSFDDARESSYAAAALQVIAWELVSDDDFNLASGDFQLNYWRRSSWSTTRVVFDFLDAASTSDAAGVSLSALVSETSQDLLFILPANQIPAPGAIAMVGVAGVLASRRRR